MERKTSTSQLEVTGVILAIVGATMFSAKAVLIKLAYSYEVSSVSLLMLRMVMALPFFLAVGIHQIRKQKQEQKEKFKAKDYFMIILLGFLGYYLASYFDFLGLKYISASLERLILFIYPTLVVILSAIIFREKVTTPQVTAIVVTYLGMVVIFSEQLDFSQYQDFWKGAGLIFLSAFIYASYLIGSGRIIQRMGSVMFTTVAMIVSCICVIIHNFFISDIETLLSLPMPVYIYSFLMAIFCTFVPSYIISEAIKRLGASNMAIIAGVGPVSTITLSAIFLGEHLTVIQFIGAFIVVLGVFLVSKAKNKKVTS